MHSDHDHKKKGNASSELPLEESRQQKARKLLERIELLDKLIAKKLHAFAKIYQLSAYD